MVANAGRLDFDTKVAPILAHRCLECHSGAKPEGGLDLSIRKRATDGGDSGAQAKCVSEH